MFARTQRLTLRPSWLEDAETIAQAIAHEEVAFKLARLPWPYTVDDARAWLMRVPAPGDVSLSILAHEGGTKPRLIGGIGIHPDGDAHELGYWLTPNAWGKGYATEAARAVVGMARYALGLQRLTSGYFVDNPASGRVLTKLGFKPTGFVVPRLCLAIGEERACALMALDLTGGELADPTRMAA